MGSRRWNNKLHKYKSCYSFYTNSSHRNLVFNCLTKCCSVVKKTISPQTDLKSFYSHNSFSQHLSRIDFPFKISSTWIRTQYCCVLASIVLYPIFVICWITLANEVVEATIGELDDIHFKITYPIWKMSSFQRKDELKATGWKMAPQHLNLTKYNTKIFFRI